jgi:hypothetical protein
MHAYSTAGWTELFLAEAGASAALPFLFAAMSLLLEAGGGLYWLVPGVLSASWSPYSMPGYCSSRSFVADLKGHVGGVWAGAAPSGSFGRAGQAVGARHDQAPDSLSTTVATNRYWQEPAGS